MVESQMNSENNVSKMRITKSSGGLDPRETYRCELEGGMIYSLRGIHWFRYTVYNEWMKVRDDCVPLCVIRDYDKFSKSYMRG